MIFSILSNLILNYFLKCWQPSSKLISRLTNGSWPSVCRTLHQANSMLVFKVNSVQIARSRQRITVPLLINEWEYLPLVWSLCCLLGFSHLWNLIKLWPNNQEEHALLRMSIKGLGKSQGQEAGCLIFSKAEWENRIFCLQNEPNRAGRNLSLNRAPVGKKTRRKNLSDTRDQPPE